VRGLVAVPITNHRDGVDQVVGAICVFDVRPLTVDREQLEALKALGRNVSLEPAPADQEGGRHTAAVDLVATDGESSGSGESAPDALALVLDRQNGELAIGRELARARREQRRLSIVLFGIDPMSQADDVTPRASLTHLARTLIRALRESDLVIDWGRHELAAVLPGLGANEARQVAERVRAAMQAGARFQVAVSAGVEELQKGEPFEAAVERAREKVQEARERGHNRVA
jgi:diguanylate cyclase (GGDEF)-like protein